MAKYTDEFRMKAVGLLRLLKEKGIIVLDSIEIKNVRMLVHELGISSYTIYKWNKELYGELIEVVDRQECDKEGWCKAYQPISDDNANCNVLGKCDDFIEVKDIDEQILDGDADWFGQEKKKSTGDQKEIFGIRYYAWFARNLGVKGYSSMVLAQLKLAIGNKLIEQSGLIDMNKASRKLKINGEGL